MLTRCVLQVLYFQPYLARWEFWYIPVSYTHLAKSEGSDNWKVAILTGTVSQGEEEFRAAEKALATYGPEHIVTATYPDNFMSEMETTVSQIVSFASDPDVKAIVMCQAVPGAKARCV